MTVPTISDFPWVKFEKFPRTRKVGTPPMQSMEPWCLIMVTGFVEISWVN